MQGGNIHQSLAGEYTNSYHFLSPGFLSSYLAGFTQDRLNNVTRGLLLPVFILRKES